MNDEQSQGAGQTGEDGAASRYREWTATLDLMPPGPKPMVVKGEYHLNLRSGAIELSEAVPQGINPRILIVDVKLVHGPGGDWVEARGEFDAVAGQYDSVMLRDEDGETCSVEVQEVH